MKERTPEQIFKLARSRGTYVIRALEGRRSRVEPKAPPPGYMPPVPTERDRILARELLAYKRSGK